MKRDNWITLYNIYRSNDGEITEYNRSVIRVHMEEYDGAVEKGSADKSADTISFFAPFTIEKETGKKFVEPEEYLRLTNRTGFFTFRKGDIVLKGKVDEDIASEKEFVLAHPDMVRVRGCTGNNFGSPAMRHWEVYCD